MRLVSLRHGDPMHANKRRLTAAVAPRRRRRRAGVAAGAGLGRVPASLFRARRLRRRLLTRRPLRLLPRLCQQLLQLRPRRVGGRLPHTHTHTHVLTEIYLCDVCSCPEILRRNTHTHTQTITRVAVGGGASWRALSVECDRWCSPLRAPLRLRLPPPSCSLRLRRPARPPGSARRPPAGAAAGRGRCVSIFLDKNRRHIGESQSKNGRQKGRHGRRTSCARAVCR
jgi:hypothetical protein